MFLPRKAVAACCAGALLSAGLLAGEQSGPPPQQEPPVFRAGVNLVRVDVTVTGDRDEPVVDLGPGDFEIIEDGVERAIETFALVRIDPDVGPDEDSLEIRSQDHAAAEAARDDVRVVAIFLDDYHITRHPAITLRLREVLANFLQTAFGPRDLLVLMDPLTPLSALEFTRDRDRLVEAVRKFEGRLGVFVPPRSALEEAQLTSRDVRRLRAEVTLSALTALVTRLGSLREGRTSVIFVSEGPPLFFASGSIDALLQEAIEAANRGNVTVHALDPRGLEMTSAFRRAAVLWRLAADTGGRAVIGTNALEEGLARAARDAGTYYLLGFVPPAGALDGKFHDIKVRVKRRGVRVLARKGYWAPRVEDLTPPSAEGAADVPGLVEARAKLAGPRTGRVVDVWFGTRKGPSGVTEVGVAWNPSADVSDVTGVGVVLETGGRRLVEFRDVAETAARAAGGGTVFEAPAGALVAKVTVLGQAGALIDEWEETVEVPVFDGRLAVSSLWFESAAPAGASGRRRPTLPVARRDFRRGERIWVSVDIDGPGDGGADALVVQLLNVRGEPLVDLPLGPAAANGRRRFELPIQSLAVGEYVLRVEARRDDATASALAAFRVGR